MANCRQSCSNAPAVQGEGDLEPPSSLHILSGRLSFKSVNRKVYDNVGYSSAILMLAASTLVMTKDLGFPGLQHVCNILHLSETNSLLVIAVAIVGILLYHVIRPVPLYLMDISCFRPPNSYRVPHSMLLEHSRLSGKFIEQSLEFQKKILERCGLGQQTAVPPSLQYLPPRPSLSSAREESENVLFTCMDELLEKTKVNPKDIGVLVVNCSIFNPTPSLAAMLVNKYKLRSDIKAYSLGGMGCSAGVIALDLAKDALLVHRNTYALVFSTENITQNWYSGNSRTMLVSNCLFRVGGSAILLSNRRSDRHLAKYRLKHVVRTHKAADDKAHHCAFQEEDNEGNVGVFLSKDLMSTAAETLRSNMTSLGPLVLPYSEKVLFMGNLIARKLFYSGVKPYVPDFKRAFEHFCIHSGGRAVISAVQKGLSLKPFHVEASRMTLHRFGNTSSSTTWYQLQYLETKGQIRKGDRIWQIAFGTGFKCNSAVWVSLRNIQPPVVTAWSDCIAEYPVVIPDILDI